MNIISGHDPLDSTSIKYERFRIYTSFLSDDIKRDEKLLTRVKYFQQGVDEKVKSIVMDAT